METKPGRSRALMIAAMLAALTLIAAACGSDDAETTAGTTDDENVTESTDAMEDADDEAMDDMDSHGDDHDHGTLLEVPDGMAVPTIAVTAEPDAESGANVFVELTDFEIAPLSASTDPVDGEGHLHLYVDGERVMRFYNTAIHLGDLDPGEHEIMVEISANNHSPYAVDGEAITAMTTVTVADGEGHSHGGEPVEVGADAAPGIEVTVYEDPKSGWNLNAELSDFMITPDAVNGENVDGEGHLHLYIDGERQGRLYGQWTHISSLSEGTREIAVELSANDHSAYAVDGEPIRGVVTLDVTAEQAAGGDGHSHGDEGHKDGESHDDHDHDDHDHDHGEAVDSTVDEAAMAEADVVINASVSDGKIEVDDDRIDVPLGSTVAILITADINEHIHLHGYDVLVDIVAGEPAMMSFVADVPGVFEIELEDSKTFLFEIAVS
ncbi:MAG: hypothetical protein AAF467_11780 [Actinomycetota bacterium]